MSSRKRITAALAGLILLVVLGWILRGQSDGHQSHGRSSGDQSGRSRSYGEQVRGQRKSLPRDVPTVEPAGWAPLPHNNSAVVDLHV